MKDEHFSLTRHFYYISKAPGMLLKRGRKNIRTKGEGGRMKIPFFSQDTVIIVINTEWFRPFALDLHKTDPLES